MLGVALIVFGLSYLAAVVTLFALRFRVGMRLVGAVPMVLLALMLGLFGLYAAPAFAKYGPGLVVSAEWNPPREAYGLLPALLGTLLTSAVAIAIAVPLALSAAVAITEFLPGLLREVVGSLMDLTAAMPTVIYGLWGLFTLGPFLQRLINGISSLLGLGVEMQAPVSLLTAGVLLGVVITPYIAAIVREGYALIPKAIEEAIYAVGATRLEAVLLKLRYVRGYVLGGLFLGLGRAMGETVAVAMVVGGNYLHPTLNLLSPGITISSLIALQFPESSGYAISVLFAAAFLLAVVGLGLNAVGVYLIRRWGA